MCKHLCTSDFNSSLICFLNLIITAFRGEINLISGNTNSWTYRYLHCAQKEHDRYLNHHDLLIISSTLSLGFGIDTTQLIRGQTSFRDLKTKTLRGKKCLKYLITYNNDNLGLWIRKSSKFTHLQLMCSAWRGLVSKVS